VAQSKEIQHRTIELFPRVSLSETDRSIRCNDQTPLGLVGRMRIFAMNGQLSLDGIVKK